VLDSRRQVALAAAAIVACLAVFQLTDLDLLMQRHLFSVAPGRWIWSRDEAISRFLFYDGIKYLIILFAVGSAIALAFSRFSKRLKRSRRGLIIVFLSLLLVPALVGSLKTATNIPCPRDLVEFGGDATYAGNIAAILASGHSQPRYRCFPAGHASGGFALLSLYFLARTRRQRIGALAIGLGTGWTMGLYKMAIGDHFLSHTIVTMMLAWLVINLIALFDARLNRAMT
tara:strand:- start:748 stop:1434 length:687 start_codon:yes stop_codon:yes gene_type:complete